MEVSTYSVVLYELHVVHGGIGTVQGHRNHFESGKAV